MDNNQVIHIDIQGELLPALQAGTDLALLRGFPSSGIAAFGDLIVFSPHGSSMVEEDGEIILCYPFVEVRRPGGYQQFRCPLESRDIEDLIGVSRELWRERIAVQGLEDERGDQWLDIALPPNADSIDAAERIMDLCCLVGAECWPYELFLAAGEVEQVELLCEQMELSGARAAYLYFLLARVQEDGEDLGKAVQSYEKALEHDPHSVVLQENLAICLANSGRGPEAEEVFRTAIEHFPEDHTLLNNYQRFLESTNTGEWMHFDFDLR